MMLTDGYRQVHCFNCQTRYPVARDQKNFFKKQQLPHTQLI